MTPRELTAVVGGGELARAARRKVELFGDMHLELVAEQDGEAATGDRTAELEELAARVDRLIVATEQIDPVLIGRLAAVCRTRR